MGTLRLSTAVGDDSGRLNIFSFDFPDVRAAVDRSHLESNMFHALLGTTAPWTLFSLIIVSAWIAAGGFKTVEIAEHI